MLAGVSVIMNENRCDACPDNFHSSAKQNPVSG